MKLIKDYPPSSLSLNNSALKFMQNIEPQDYISSYLNWDIRSNKMGKRKFKDIDKDIYQNSQSPKGRDKSIKLIPRINAYRMITLTLKKKAWNSIKQMPKIWASKWTNQTRCSKNPQKAKQVSLDMTNIILMKICYWRFSKWFFNLLLQLESKHKRSCSLSIH